MPPFRSKDGRITWLWKVVIGIAGSLGTVATAIVTVPPAWRTLGLPALATELHVEQRLKPLAAAVDDLRRMRSDDALQIAEIRRSQVDKEMFEWRIKLGDVAEPGLRAMIETRLAELALERTTVLRRIEALQGVPSSAFGPR
jgi:hypothetical protein